jgi:CheY-like chemotaxis protein
MKFGLNGIARRVRYNFTVSLGIAWTLALPLFLFGAASVGAADAESAGAPHPNQTNYASFQTALRDQMHADSELPKAGHEEPKVSGWHNVLCALEIAVCMVLSFRLIVPKIGKLLQKRLDPVTAPAAEVKAAIVKESVGRFVTELQIEPRAPKETGESRKAVFEEFFKVAPGKLKALRKLFAEISSSADSADRQRILGDINVEVTSIKNRMGSLELTSAWHLASSLEKLIGQLFEKPASITASTLRTAAGGLLLLDELCVPDIRKDLATNPSARFLGVDDDPISRRAVSMSLKKVAQAQAPDLAEHGEAALELAGRHAYDAIFLDVEMPGLDGFEVCTKIHQLELNRLTPVVFVTSHSDFESRAKSTSSGGRDLIAKPFLSSEITLKALTLLLRGRLDAEKASRELSTKQVLPVKGKTPVVAKTETKSKELSSAAANAVEVDSPQTAKKEAVNSQTASSAAANKDRSKPPAASVSSESTASSKQEAVKAFAADGAVQLRDMLKQLSALELVKDPEEREELLRELYMGLNMLRSEAAQAGLKAVCELASALGKLVAKVLDKPALFTSTAQQAITTAIRLLEEIVPDGVEPDLSNPPVRALVVDDDPIARRAISNALQLTFGKPDNAENGNAAVALAESKVFDVIFLDIMMPDMDGFETCSKIRKTRLNVATPVVFVSSQNDGESRQKSTHCGGNGLISKPILPAEIFLTALTFTLRARMRKSDASAATTERLEAALC